MLAAAVITAGVLAGKAMIKKKALIKCSVFSWYEDGSSADQIQKIVKLCEQDQIDTVYQYVERDEIDSDSFTAYVNALSQADVHTLLIYDEPEYSLKDFQDYLGHIKASSAAVQIDGVMIDIEPYADRKDHDPAVLKEYVSYMKQYGEAASAEDLKFMITIPTWYDTISQSLTKELIACADRTVFMNYTREDIASPISFEVQAAADAGREFEDAVELQPVDEEQGITSSMTYDGAGLSAVQDDFLQLLQTYPDLRGCYHHLRPLYQMTYGKELQ